MKRHRSRTRHVPGHLATAVLADEGDRIGLRPLPGAEVTQTLTQVFPDRFPALPDETRPFTAIEATEAVEAARVPRFIPHVAPEPLPAPQPEPEPAPSSLLPPVPLTLPATIGLGLVAEMPDAYGVLPCGHCGAAYADAGTAFAGDEYRPLDRLADRAVAEGWRSDANLVWSCPQCQQDPDWRAADTAMTMQAPAWQALERWVHHCEQMGAAPARRPEGLPRDWREWERWVDHCDQIGAAPAYWPDGIHPAVDYEGCLYAEHAWYRGKVDALNSRMALRIGRGMSQDTARTITLNAAYADIDGLFEVATANVHRPKRTKGAHRREPAA